MAWTPEFTVLNTSAIAGNLLAFILANQVDALTWAGGSTLKPLASVTAKVTNPTVPMLPSIGIEKENERPDDDDGEVIKSVYSVIFEIWVENADPDLVTVQAKVYAKALMSLIQECPVATLINNTAGAYNLLIRERPEVDFEAVKSLHEETHFFQMFQIRASFTLSGSAFS